MAVIGDRDLDGISPLTAIWRRPEQSVLHRVFHTGTHANLQTAIPNPPIIGLFPQPRPAAIERAIECVLENDLFIAHHKSPIQNCQIARAHGREIVSGLQVFFVTPHPDTDSE